MKTINSILIYGVILISYSQCQKNEGSTAMSCPIEELPFSTWEAIRFEENGTNTTPPKNYVLTFSEGGFSLTLDVNTCSGSLKLCEADQDLDFITGGCTYACCDSDFAQKMINFMFEEVASFELTNQELILLDQSGGDKKVVFRARN